MLLEGNRFSLLKKQELSHIMDKLSKTQREVLITFYELQEKNEGNIPPRPEEIGIKLGKSAEAIRKTLNILVRKNVLGAVKSSNGKKTHLWYIKDYKPLIPPVK